MFFWTFFLFRLSSICLQFLNLNYSDLVQYIYKGFEDHSMTVSFQILNQQNLLQGTEDEASPMVQPLQNPDHHQRHSSIKLPKVNGSEYRDVRATKEL